MFGKTNRWRLVLAAAAMAMGAFVLLDALGVLRPAPPAARLLSKFATARKQMPSYEAEVSVGRWGTASGTPRSCRQWVVKDEEVVFASPDMGGFIHVERWTGASREYYQPGADLLVHVSIANLGRIPYARWLISGFPTLGDLEAAVSQASHPRVVGQQQGSDGVLWMLECRPALPRADLAGETPEFAAQFYQETFGHPWVLWLSEKTGLPVHLRIRASEQRGGIRIGVENVRRRPPTPVTNWKTIAIGKGRVARTFRLRCDASSAASLEAADARILAAVNRWRRTLYGPRAMAGRKPQ